jgi:hypothetical protein
VGLIENRDRPSGNGKQAGKVKGRMQHATAAASAVAVAAPAILPPAVSFVAQAQPGAFSDGSAQDGPITRM